MYQLMIPYNFGHMTAQISSECTHKPLYNTAQYNKILDIIRFKDGSQKWTDYIEK